MKQSQRVAVISNITIEVYFGLVINELLAKQNVTFKVTSVPYQEYQKQEYQNVFREADVIIVWLNFEVLISDVRDGKQQKEKIKDINNLCQDIFYHISESTNANIIWFLFEGYFSRLPVITGYVSNAVVDEVNLRLQKELPDTVTFIKLERMIAEVGIANAFDIKSKYRWNFPYSKSLVEAIAVEMQKQYCISKGITPKCLVLDCDNVLWGGILSEEGIENIKLGNSGLGREYQEFQRFVLSLYHRGVILAVCSKNDLADVLKMFREHSEMILREEHIACFQVNWESKPDNIKKIAEMLNISMESLVFVDDSPVEIEAVRAFLPEVTVIPYHREKMYNQFSCFNLKDNFNYVEVSKRNETYRTNRHRKLLKEAYENYSDYIEALEMKIDIHRALPIEYGRIAELTQRTNKCTNGKRYTVADLKKQVSCKDVNLYSVFLLDRYSDLGLVGAFEIRGGVLTLFSLSCRALGRDVENKMICYIAEQYCVKKINFMRTAKNGDLKMILTRSFPESEIGDKVEE